MNAAQLHTIGVPQSPASQVLQLAHLAVGAGIHGLVCSSEETSELRKAVPEDVLLVVPGIRPAGSPASADQSRVATPANALADGASMLVIGRPITQAALTPRKSRRSDRWPRCAAHEKRSLRSVLLHELRTVLSSLDFASTKSRLKSFPLNTLTEISAGGGPLLLLQFLEEIARRAGDVDSTRECRAHDP